MKDFWNQRYAEQGYAYGDKPNAFLAAQKDQLQPGMRVLAVGDGEGRNGVWLAQQKCQVTCVDYSEQGVRKTKALAAANGVRVDAQCHDLTEWQWPQGEFDRVVSIFLHFPPNVRAAMHQAMLKALKPGGVIILEAFTPEQLNYKSGGPPVVEMLYTPEMLAEDFAGGEILFQEQCVTFLEEGVYHHGDGAVVRMLIRRP